MKRTNSYKSKVCWASLAPKLHHRHLSSHEEQGESSQYQTGAAEEIISAGPKENTCFLMQRYDPLCSLHQYKNRACGPRWLYFLFLMPLLADTSSEL